ncbi:MAG: hypothetical protein ACKVX7_04285 [Planctomycetota bacterium]
MRPRLLILLAVLACVGCHTTSGVRPQLFGDLGSYTRAVTTVSKPAREFFSEGLLLAYAFNYDEADRSFREAARLDPTMALAWWGVALVNGPHINSPMLDEAHSRAAWAAVEETQKLKSGASDVERALIDAMARRYAPTYSADRRALDEDYARAMAEVYERFPNDFDVATLYAESLMDLQPWDLYTRDGKSKGSTDSIVQVLEGVLRQAPDHPGACHLYIHAVEASKSPERAVAAADRLRSLVPGASHLVHMPSHIYTRVGRYTDAALSNEQAIAADDAYLARSATHNIYHFYRLHNYHFLSYSHMMAGRFEDALRAADALFTRIPSDYLEREAALTDGFLAMRTHVLVRFGKWEELLAEPRPASHYPVSIAFWHYARGLAASALGDIARAQRELAEFERARGVVNESIHIGLNPASTIFEIAHHMLRGELAFRERRHDESFALLRHAAELEDQIIYDEPPDWIQPVRHALGALLVQAIRHLEAEAVFRDDLTRNPENGWALYGLVHCLEARGAGADAKLARDRFTRAWQKATFELKSSCACQPW